MKAQNVENISHYHSVEFQGSKIRFGNYYSVGNGISVDIKPPKCISGLEVLTSFEKTETSFITPSRSKKPLLARMRNDQILYYPTNDCVKTFLNSKSLKEHISMREHVYWLKGIDQVNQTYINDITNSDFNNLNNDSHTSYLPDNSFPMGLALPQKRLLDLIIVYCNIYIYIYICVCMCVCACVCVCIWFVYIRRNNKP